MVFVTSRNATASVAKRLIEITQEKGTLSLFEPERTSKLSKGGFKSGDLVYLAPQGFGIHHAGKNIILILYNMSNSYLICYYVYIP